MHAVVLHAAKEIRVEEVACPPMRPTDVRVQVELGGICGSDLHLYLHGGVGDIRVQQPLILGHEVGGRVVAAGSGVTRVHVGDRVVVNPGLACGVCRRCREGLQHHCAHMRFLGSAKRNVQGGFRQHLVIDESQAFPITSNLSMEDAVFAEPLAVCLHAAERAGSLLGKRVLITGCGPIGLLAITVAKLAGAAEIVATDIDDAPLAMALRLGADAALNTREAASALQDYEADNGTLDVLFEASGNERALRGALAALRPRAVMVQIGLGGTFSMPINDIVFKELQLRGTFRFNEEFGLALRLLEHKRLDVAQLVTLTLPFTHAAEAFDLAADRSRSLKVQLSFGPQTKETARPRPMSI